MIQKLFKILQKLDILTILDIKDSYFKTLEVRNKKKVSKEVISLNYAELSPYKEFDIVYYQSNAEINLWFTDIKQKSNIILPESYIFAHYFIQEHREGIILFDTVPQKLLLIKDAKLKYQLCKKNISNYELALLKKEFAISEVHSLTQEEYKTTLTVAIEQLSLVNIFNFLSIELNYKTILNLIVKKSALPVAIVVSLLLLLEFANSLYLKERLEKITAEYKSIRKKSSTLRDKMYAIEDQTQKYTLLEKELNVNTKFITIINGLSDILRENNTTFLFLRLSDSEFRVKIDSNQTAKVFSDIVKSNYLKDLRIQSTRKNRYTDGESVIITGKIN